MRHNRCCVVRHLRPLPRHGSRTKAFDRLEGLEPTVSRAGGQIDAPIGVESLAFSSNPPTDGQFFKVRQQRSEPRGAHQSFQFQTSEQPRFSREVFRPLTRRRRAPPSAIRAGRSNLDPFPSGKEYDAELSWSGIPHKVKEGSGKLGTAEHSSLQLKQCSELQEFNLTQPLAPVALVR